MVLSEEINLRPYQPRDEEKIVQLLELVFDGWPKLDIHSDPISYWRWKYRNQLHESIVVVSTYHDEIVGCHHGLSFSAKILTGSFICNYGSDMAVHPEFRRKGISKNQLELLKKLREETGVKYALILAANPINIQSIAKREKSFPHDLVNLVKIWDIDKQLKGIPVDKTMTVKIGYKILKLLNDIRNFFTYQKPSVDNIEISEIKSFDEDVDNFWRKASEEYDFIVERNRDYLNWRYCNPQAGRFTIKKAEEEGNFVGYAVLKISNQLKDYPVGFVVDLLTLKSRQDVVDALISDAIEYFISEGINIINYLTIKNHQYEKAFKKKGFLDSRIKFHLFYKLLDIEDKIRKLKDSSADRILFSWGDHDSLPVQIPRY